MSEDLNKARMRVKMIVTHIGENTLSLECNEINVKGRGVVGHEDVSPELLERLMAPTWVWGILEFEFREYQSLYWGRFRELVPTKWEICPWEEQKQYHYSLPCKDVEKIRDVINGRMELTTAKW